MMVILHTVCSTFCSVLSDGFSVHLSVVELERGANTQSFISLWTFEFFSSQLPFVGLERD